jgi:hypothetical protein
VSEERLILDAEKAVKLAARKAAFVRDIDNLADNLYGGRITLGMFEEDFRTRMRMYLNGSAMIGKGDIRLNRSEIGKVGAQLKKQYRWLHGFTQDIYDRRETISIEAIKARAHLYADAGDKVATEIQAGYFAPNARRKPTIILSWMPRDGSTVCLNRCGCQWVMEVMGENADAGTKTVQATWQVNPVKEHCEDCLPRNGHVEIVEVPVDENVPEFIGLGG